jgi:crotonobetainyl-CoA:carnitine CoA-transferase CaiB-like acyl-CoA transferase
VSFPNHWGSGYPFTVPYGVYKTGDGYIVLGPCWPRIAHAIGAEWLVADPQVNALNMILDIEHPLGGRIKVAGNPIMMDSLIGEHTAPPTLGQHTEQVLRDFLHYTDEKINALGAEQKTTDLKTRLHTRKEE